MKPKYLQQYERVQRMLRRIKRRGIGQEEYEDDLWSFFQNCHHLKDWMANDESCEINSDEAEALVDSNRSLRICADMANRTKHLTLTRTIRENAEVVRKDVNIDLTHGTEYTYYIGLEDGASYKALDVAREAVTVWREFFINNGLLDVINHD